MDFEQAIRDAGGHVMESTDQRLCGIWTQMLQERADAVGAVLKIKGAAPLLIVDPTIDPRPREQVAASGLQLITGRVPGAPWSRLGQDDEYVLMSSPENGVRL